MNAGSEIVRRDALLRSARTLRSQQKLPDALATLDRLQALFPDFSQLYQERGHCHILQGNAPAAIEALQNAVRLNPTLPASWDMLAQLYRRQGDSPRADHAAQQCAALMQLPPEIVVANSLVADGDLGPAEEILRDYLRADQGNVGALRLLARICLERGTLAEAEATLSSVLALAPDYHAARLDYAMVLLQGQKPSLARDEARRLLEHDPENRDYLKQYGAALVALGDHEPVIPLYTSLIEGPSTSEAEIADLRLFRANALKISGRQDEAIADYRASLAARPDYAVAWFSLANLKTYRFSDEDIARMQATEGRPSGHDMDHVYLCFALGKAFEDRGDYALSWQYYARGNDRRRLHSRYRAEAAEASAKRLKQVFTADFFARRADWGMDDAAPIFILGLPRSGSTLIEQILATHSAVEGTQELTEIGRYAGEVCGLNADCGLPLQPDAYKTLTAEAARSLGARYLKETRTYRKLGRPYFIDKMPNNFWHIGLIHLMLPKATIIDIRREPMACGFSNAKQLFGTINQEFSYSLEDIAGYYRTYLDLMRHWDDVLPGRVIRVLYEDLVDDLEGKVRRLLDASGLPFEPACLAFHENRRSVRTPSSEQVRQPIGREGLAQWKHYAPWLHPLQVALGEALTHYKD